MWYSYFKIALRNLFRQKAYSFINIFGLAVSMACSILILIWVQDELSYDRFHTHADQLYRITCSMPDIKAATSVVPMAPALKAQMPEVENTVRLWRSTNLFEVANRKFEEKDVIFADATFLEMFSFPLLQGDPKTALLRPDGIIITEATAQKYFGKTKALGQMIRKDNQDNFVVTGVLANVPTNSHLQFDFILPMSFLARTNYDLKVSNWNNFDFYTYVQLQKNAVSGAVSLQKLNQRISQIFLANNKEIKIDFQLQPITSIHLHSNLLLEFPGNGSIQYVRIFSIVAFFILVVACINFMNLATARSARRAKEVGLRKVIGARRNQLIGQFLSESTIISGLALLLAIGLVWGLLPVFNHLADKNLTIKFWDVKLLFTLLGIALATGLLSGSYPALFLSNFQSIKVLKGGKIGTSNVLFRNALVVTQFVISIVLLVGTAVVYKQLQFIHDKHLGFDKENLLYLPMTGELWSKQQALEVELKQNPLTSHYTIISDLPTNLTNGTVTVYWEGKDPASQPLFPEIKVDENFISVFRMKLLSGRSFSKALKSDTANYIVNETALRVMGMDRTTAIGKPLTYQETKGTIIGVVQDFNFKPMQRAIEPLVLRFNQGGGKVVIRTTPSNTQATIKALEKIDQALNPSYPFTYNFLDQDIANLYRTEQRMGTFFNVFAVWAILISCLGLYGLSAFMAEQRTKEIGVRKVLGASILDIVYLLGKNFIRLLLLAIIVAVPLSWWAMNSWLENYVYRIELNWIILLAACLTAFLIAALTVSYESIKAAITNPVKALRSE
ncbi:ABC transporter permease [Adhaeribacter arboris]|uniref:ABC transporter permease n=1 Tax=Adhaeribacter arboris TaxID=2072846 RepID=A0A2T2YHU3_9BACT|nr:ABC transporter permease [Adhaeribacter arboris]PSR55079.1 ABC transporter permease [Adhaeribacter arboris]